MSKILVVDQNNNPIGEEERQVVTDKGLIRRIASILLFDDKGNIYLQWRSASKNIFPNTWGQAAGGHVELGDLSDEKAAIRELKEEIGIDRDKLDFLCNFYCEENYQDIHIKEWVALYKTVSHDDKLTLDTSEVEKGKWFSILELTEAITNSPEQFSEGFKITWNKYQEYLKKLKLN